MTTETITSCPKCGSAVLGGARFCMQCGGAVTGGAGRHSTGLSDPLDRLQEQLALATEGEYQILAELGRGGMAAVYLADDLALGRRVAIKVMIPGLRGTEGMADRFLLEARTAAQLSHPHIIPIHAVRTTGQLRYFVMKYIGGRSLDRVLAENGPLPPRVVQAVLAQVGSALEHAHRRGVVHRDIKPGNIMLDEDGAAIVADFGIAKVAQGVSLTQTGSTVGTPTYMSPEQCSGRPVTGASDQYALGCVAFELTAGRPPFAYQEVLPVLLAHVSEQAPPLLQFRPDCPLELAAAIDKMLAKDPADRWGSIPEAVAAAEAGPHAGDPAVRELMRGFSGAETGVPLQIVASIPVSPIPLARTALIEPRLPIEPRPEAVPGAMVFAIAIEPNGALLQAGVGLQLQATARDKAGLPVQDARIEWQTSAPDLVSVTASGVVTARREGEAEVTASAPQARATVRIRVARVPVGQLRVTTTAGAWQVGERRLLSAVALDQAGAVLPGRPVLWICLDPRVATIDPDGAVHAKGPGRARIRAEVEGQIAEACIDVEGTAGRLVVIPGAGAIAVGQHVSLAVSVEQSGGELRGVTHAVWSSSDPTVLRVSPDGELSGFRPGTARIRVSASGLAAEVEYQVTRVDVSEVRITPRLATLGAGEEIRLEAEATDRLGGTLERRIIGWASSHPGIATVGPGGVLRGVAPGTARISASIGGGLASIEVRVTPLSVSAIRLEPAGLVLRVGEAGVVRAAVQARAGHTVPGVPIQWQSSDPSVASVDRDGRVSAHRFGTARIAATAGGRRATLPVEVRAASPTSGVRIPINPT